MVWFRVDDTLAFHMKTLRAGNEAMGVWVRAGAESSSQLTDGFVSTELVDSLGPKRLAQRLVDSGLWMICDGGYQFHDWQDRNPTRKDVEQERNAARERKERWKERHKNDDGTPSGTRSDVRSERRENNAPTRPDPTRPVVPTELPKTEAAQKRGTRLNDDWKPTPEDITWQRSKGISDLVARRSLETFVNYWTAKPGREAIKLDWSKTWRNWLLRDHTAPTTTKPSKPSRPDGWEFGMG